ncbi:MAG: hypothetical protein J1F33_01610 [Clostridiales bacterium]|nr:hypothetical protein [Clostridiales bacterium]
MKNRKKGLVFYFTGAAFLIFAAVGFIAYVGLLTSEEVKLTPLLVAAIISFVVSIVLLIIGYRFSFLIDKETAQLFERYSAYPAKNITDYRGELEFVRENLKKDTDPDKNKIGVFPFAGSTPFYDFDVIKTGKIYYSYVVEANESLFFNRRIDRMTLPAVVIYGIDPYFESDPLALKEIADSLFENRNQNFLRDESQFFTAKKLTDRQGRTVYATTVMVYRKHLPLYCLSDALLPIIADPQNSTSVFFADCKYWTDGLIGDFVNGVARKKEYKIDPFGI